MKTLAIEKQDQLGEEIASIFHLKKNKNGRYNTMWGDKTAIGLLNVVYRIVEGIEKRGEI